MSSSRKVIPIAPVSGARNDGAQFVSMYQKPAAIYPRAVKGWFATWRWVFVWLTQLLFYGVPWLQWGGRQAVLFDLEAQRHRGVAKNTAQLHTLFALANLWMARKRLVGVGS